MKTNEFRKRVLPLKDNLFRVAYRITGNAEQSERIVEEVVLRVWADRASLVVIEDLPAYCLTMVRKYALRSVCGHSVETDALALR